MEFTIKSLQDKIPASVYELLTTEDYMSLPIPKEEDIDKAHSIISPPHIPNGWFPVSQRHLTEEEIKAVKSCTVVKSDFGLSMEFKLTNEEVKYIPCGNIPLFETGQEWHPKNLKLIELGKYGEDTTIWRIAPITKHVDVRVNISKEEYILREKTFGEMLHRYYDLMKRDGKKISIFKYLRLY